MTCMGTSDSSQVLRLLSSSSRRGMESTGVGCSTWIHPHPPPLRSGCRSRRLGWWRSCSGTSRQTPRSSIDWWLLCTTHCSACWRSADPCGRKPRRWCSRSSTADTSPTGSPRMPGGETVRWALGGRRWSASSSMIMDIDDVVYLIRCDDGYVIYPLFFLYIDRHMCT